MAAETSTNGFTGNRRQITQIAGGALLLALIIFMLWYFVLRTPMAPAFTELKTADASLIVDELKKQKLPYKLDDNGATILVPSDQVDATRLAILGGDLPLKGTVGFELFSKSDMGLTEFAQKINYQRALQGELARTLMSLSNIESARVHITLPESGIFQDDHRPAKASVTIAPKLGATIDAPTITGVQRLVASAVEDLDAGNVVVLDGTGKQLSADMSDLGAQPMANGETGGIAQAYSAQVRAVALQLVNDPAMRVTVWAPADAQVTPSGPDSGSAAKIARHFPLRITIALSGGSPPELHDRLATVLQSSIGFDPTQGDTLTLVRLPTASPYQLGPPIASATGVTQSGNGWGKSEVASQGLWWIIALALLTAAIIFFALRLSRTRAMSSKDRDSFAVRLRELLDQDERLRSEQA
jgi:flagellar M-ring protein FliF